MPIYEYKCTKCDYQCDRLQKISDDPLVDCPECQLPGLVKLVSAPSFRLSGSGWYETDFKTDKDKKKNLAGDVGADKSKSSNESSTDKNKSSDKNSGGSKEKSTSKKAV